jgi:hypothetical protein
MRATFCVRLWLTPCMNHPATYHVHVAEPLIAASMIASSIGASGGDAGDDRAVLIDADVSAVSATSRNETDDEKLARLLQEKELNAANNAIHKTMMKDYAERRIYR